MYISVRKYRMQKPGTVPELMRRVDAGNDTVASISIFQDQAGADESNRLAADWVRGNLLELVRTPPDTTAGEVRTSRMGHA